MMRNFLDSEIRHRPFLWPLILYGQAGAFLFDHSESKAAMVLTILLIFTVGIPLLLVAGAFSCALVLLTPLWLIALVIWK